MIIPINITITPISLLAVNFITWESKNPKASIIPAEVSWDTNIIPIAQVGPKDPMPFITV